jgi:cell division protein FtsB
MCWCGSPAAKVPVALLCNKHLQQTCAAAPFLPVHFHAELLLFAWSSSTVASTKHSATTPSLGDVFAFSPSALHLAVLLTSVAWPSSRAVQHAGGIVVQGSVRVQLEELCDLSLMCAPARARRHREAIGQLRSDNKQLQSDNKQLQSDNKQLQSDKEQLQAEVLALRMQLERSQAQVQELQQQQLKVAQSGEQHG